MNPLHLKPLILPLALSALLVAFPRWSPIPHAVAQMEQPAEEPDEEETPEISATPTPAPTTLPAPTESPEPAVPPTPSPSTAPPPTPAVASSTTPSPSPTPIAPPAPAPSAPPRPAATPTATPTATPPPQEISHRLDGKTPEERAAALLRYVASVRPTDETFPKAAAPAYAARLLLGVDTKYALEKLDAAASRQIDRAKAKGPQSAHALDPFDKFALVCTYFLAKDKIPKPTALKIRDYAALYEHRVLKGYAKGAWNYHLMMDGAGYLAAEEWPEMVDIEGLNAEQIKKATKDRLMADFETICTRNFSEYGATIYLAVDLSAVRMVAEFARDPELRKRATFALDAMMLDIACTWNQGYNAGTASRAKYWGSTDTSPENMGATAAAAWIFFGANRPISGRGTGWIHSLWMAAPGRYAPPELIAKIARERSRPFLHRGFVAGTGGSVHRTTYHSQNYSLCSQWDQAGSFTSGLYKESRRNMLKWISDKPSSTFAVCMENPRRPYALKENKANAIGYGENPFSQYLQCEGTLLGIYAVPDNYPYYKLYAPFPASGSIIKILQKNGWVFCHNGSMLMAFRSVQPCTWAKQTWSNNYMLWCNARRNAWILDTSELTPFAGGGPQAELDKFASAILTKTQIDTSQVDRQIPTLRYKSLAGHVIEITFQPHAKPYDGQQRIDGKQVVYGNWPLQSNPFVSQAANSPYLKIKVGDESLRYDFSTWTREEHTETPPPTPE